MKKNRFLDFINGIGINEKILPEGHQIDSNHKSITNSRKSSTIRIISKADIMRSTRRLDRLLSLFSEDEASLLADSKIAARVEVSTAKWTMEKLINMVHQNLAEVNIVIEYNGETLQIPKYSEQIIDLAPKLAVFKPTSGLTINLSDLNPEIIRKLYKLDKESREYVLLAAGKRLFKIFFPYYYNMAAHLIKVKIER